MANAKSKGGTGRGTGKKGWNRWQASAKKTKSAPKPYATRADKDKKGNSKSTPTTKSTD
ncbi:DUF3934 family protein [Paenibacillus sp. PK4536]|uniref:DUF3934 domain-containing protein n=2 Tax=Paenibacillus TaxID=44249 RepID=A0A1E3L716_9BACL|nr:MULTISPECIES: DUF3934 family protein [Paenibacillus]MDN4617489.1 DUF3934 family protein [Paenibacillus sp. PsM32]MDQ1232664.1 hypothetical protein [Paenibacillus sp. SORGH_AS_0306]MDR6109715.1 hypothetical protein [Paenibacillus sp. SORGH_AS_0338]ODP29391.1 hypothetical protein PTI45_01400 [Paenibacillus nuruki]TKJ93600.1 DUF3934 domain-containing protein [Paenibacillus sp. CFBP13512]